MATSTPQNVPSLRVCQRQPNPTRALKDFACIKHSGCPAHAVPRGWSTATPAAVQPRGISKPRPSGVPLGPSKASLCPLSILCAIRPLLGTHSTVASTELRLPPRLGLRSEAPRGHWSQPSRYQPCYRLGAIIAGRHEAGDKPRSSPQPFLMGQREPSPREQKERLWLEWGGQRGCHAHRPAWNNHWDPVLRHKPTPSPARLRAASQPRFVPCAPALHPLCCMAKGALPQNGQGGS